MTSAKNGTSRSCEEAERLRKNGSRIRVALKWATIRDETGAVIGIVETARGRRSHADSPANYERLRALLEQMPAILWTTDRHLHLYKRKKAAHAHSLTVG